ncbi:F-box/FBD/LRR-repeat protein-like protein [Tanacetum coccineum]|uniref:F-box/FBD/LRR-repeat protein-like protein n=1 Tax=Tanacetum coccineum TaxID=301880 RepID=A0ABQ5C2X2_9ASTR
MEPVHQADKASKPSSADVISSMPANVITNILDRLMIKNAVGTSMLSRNWRFKYTLLTQLVFDDHGFAEGSWFDERDISRLLLDLKGPITKFVLIIPNYKILDVKDINHWIMFLSKKGIVEFQNHNKQQTQMKLRYPSLLCLRAEKHLKIHNVLFILHPVFVCPVLEILKISYDSSIGELKLADIAKLANLSTLSLPLSKLEDVTSTSSITSQIGSYFPNLQELYLDLRNYNFIGEAGARKFVRRNIFPSLKTLTLNAINVSNGNMVLWAFLIIFGCPILQTLNITIQNVLFSSCRGSEVEICLIKYLLACSPLLKQFIVRCDTSLMSDDKLIDLANEAKMIVECGCIRDKEWKELDSCATMHCDHVRRSQTGHSLKLQ